MTNKEKYKVVHMVTVAESVGLMKGQLGYLKNAGFDVIVISSPGERLYRAGWEENVNIKAIKMERTISPFKDLISLFKILGFFAELKPQICNAGTPKAGLLGMIAAWFTRVPFRIYTIRGLAFEGESGFKRKLLMFTEKVACACAHKVICISPSIEKVALNLKLTTKDEAIVFGEGSSNGLQLEKYEYNEIIDRKVKEIKNKYCLEAYGFIVGYVGRINNSKGIKELIEAFEILQKEYPNIALLLVGRKEKKDPIDEKVEEKIANNPNIFEIGHVSDPIPYYYVMDILAFPTYREGFGNVSIEAQATGTPVVTTNVTGAVDTIINNETGILVAVKDVTGLKNAIEKFIKNPKLIREMGKKGKERAFEKFDSRIIWESLERLYTENISSNQNTKNVML